MQLNHRLHRLHVYIHKWHAEDKALLTVSLPGQHPSPVTSALLWRIFAVWRREEPAPTEEPSTKGPRAGWDWQRDGHLASKHCQALGLLASPMVQNPSMQPLEAEHLRHPLQAQEQPSSMHSTASKWQQPAEAVMELSPKSWAGEETQNQTKNDICHIITLPAFLWGWGGGVPTKYMDEGTMYFYWRNASWEMVPATAVTTWKIPCGNSQGICRESTTV